MPDTTPGGKTLLTLTRLTINPGGPPTVESANSFEAMINPGEFKHDYSIVYNTLRTLGQLGSDSKFAAVNPEKISFSTVIDGTGVVPPLPGRPPLKPVMTQIGTLLKVVYQYVGDQHEPAHVRLLWGTLIFFGRLESMATTYSLFKPSGDPLRAKVDLSFVGFMSTKESELVSNRSSPDLSHRVEVRQGDTLPLLCDRIYGDSLYYLDVARFNGLSDFRRLVPGAKLHFPPLG